MNTALFYNSIIFKIIFNKRLIIYNIDLLVFYLFLIYFRANSLECLGLLIFFWLIIVILLWKHYYLKLFIDFWGIIK